MQFGRVISFKNFCLFFSSLKKNLVLIIFALLFIIGFFIGTFSYKGNNTIASVYKDMLETFVNLRHEGTFLKIASNSFLGNFTHLVLMFFFGTSVLGIAVLPFISMFCGIYYGGIFAALYSVYALKGIAYSMVFVLPCAVIFSAVLMQSAKESVAFSLKTARLTFSRSMPYSLYFDFKNYCGRYIFFTVILLVIAIIESILTYYFGDNLKLI